MRNLELNAEISHTGCLHICAKRICDRLLTFDIIDQKACRSYGEQDSRSVTKLQVYFSVHFSH
jgi:hypothetical protein